MRAEVHKQAGIVEIFLTQEEWDDELSRRLAGRRAQAEALAADFVCPFEIHIFVGNCRYISNVGKDAPGKRLQEVYREREEKRNTARAD